MAITRIEDRTGNEIKVNKDGALNVQATEETVKDSWEGDSNEVREFPEPMKMISIVNDGATDMFFTIETTKVRVRTKEGYEDRFAPFTEVNIEASGPYRAVVKG